jgi:glycosyltransferase involved in cell wall biosynthesis
MTLRHRYASDCLIPMAAASKHRVDLLIIGPSAPPHNGMTLATDLLVKATETHFTHVRLDTADRRGLSNVGKFDLGNVLFALRHGIEFLKLLVTKWPRAVYVQIAQAWLPFLRDCLFLIPARLTHRVVIVHLHGSAFGNFYRGTSPVMRRVIRYAIGNAACGIILGTNIGDVFDGIIPRERVCVVPNGIPDYFANQTQHDRENSAPVLFFLGALVAEKGFLDVLRALPQVKERVGSFRVIFAGELCSQRDTEIAKGIIAKFALGDYVEFVGPIGPERKFSLFREADIFVFPSANEGQPFVILEAMAAGLPVISTTVGCIPEMVQDEVTGFLIHSGDIEKLAEKICTLITRNSLRRKMGEAGRHRFMREYSFDRFAERICSVFSQVLTNDPGNAKVEAFTD